jgi:hypothetical protein
VFPILRDIVKGYPAATADGPDCVSVSAGDDGMRTVEIQAVLFVGVTSGVAVATSTVLVTARASVTDAASTVRVMREKTVLLGRSPTCQTRTPVSGRIKG